VFVKFNDLKLDPRILRGVSDLGFTDPTPIQAAALPSALDGRDVLATAETGSGKTAAFVLPILQRLAAQGRTRTIRALVLTPTRELASQIHDAVESLGRHLPIRSATVFGGVKPAGQIRALRSGVDIVIATPGRLLDHMSQPWFRINDLEVLVLDEADRMLDMGFLPDVRRILARLPARRQTMLFSATMPAPIAALSRDLLDRPEQVAIQRRMAPAAKVSQAVYSVHEQQKKDLLVGLLNDEVHTALVFTRTKHRANRLAKYLDRAGIACERIHGNRTQSQRDKALAAFKGGRIRVLVATDVASRGIDIKELPHVINFDVPGQPEDYVHRVGRTARAGLTGTALTLVTPEEEGGLRAIERVVGRRIERRRLAGFAPSTSSAPPADRPQPNRRSMQPAPADHSHRSRNRRQRTRGSRPSSGRNASRNAA
jgi:ATP-dependent RNA helicase RhlE